LPQALMDMLVNYFARQLGCASAGLAPVLRGGELAALLVIGRAGEINDPSIDGQTCPGSAHPRALAPMPTWSSWRHAPARTIHANAHQTGRAADHLEHQPGNSLKAT
jgi:hypothetical protein